jgi:hypothetical protein
MKIKALIQWIDESINNYNVFIPEEDEYDDETDEPQDPVIVLKHQRYATRLYSILFIGKYVKYITEIKSNRIFLIQVGFDSILENG